MNEIGIDSKVIRFPRMRIVARARELWDDITQLDGNALDLLPGGFAMGWDGCEVTRRGAQPSAPARGTSQDGDNVVPLQRREIQPVRRDGFFVAPLVRMTRGDGAPE
mgnify:CR=1 FL=1